MFKSRGVLIKYMLYKRHFNFFVLVLSVLGERKNVYLSKTYRVAHVEGYIINLENRKVASDLLDVLQL